MAASDWDRLNFPISERYDDSSAENIFGADGMRMLVTKNHGVDVISAIRTTAPAFDKTD